MASSSSKQSCCDHVFFLICGKKLNVAFFPIFGFRNSLDLVFFSPLFLGFVPHYCEYCGYGFRAVSEQFSYGKSLN